MFMRFYVGETRQWLLKHQKRRYLSVSNDRAPVKDKRKWSDTIRLDEWTPKNKIDRRLLEGIFFVAPENDDEVISSGSPVELSDLVPNDTAFDFDCVDSPSCLKLEDV
jgi:hypothetical protein